MNTVKLTAVYVSPKNPKWAILCPVIEIVTAEGRTLQYKGAGGFLPSTTDWKLGESITLPVGSYKITTSKTKDGSELPVIELLA